MGNLTTIHGQKTQKIPYLSTLSMRSAANRHGSFLLLCISNAFSESWTEFSVSAVWPRFFTMSIQVGSDLTAPFCAVLAKCQRVAPHSDMVARP